MIHGYRMLDRVSLIPYGRALNKEREALVFTHIPKTAGTSLHEAIGAALDGNYAILTPATLSEIEFKTIGGVGGHQPFLATPLSKTKRQLVHMTILRDPVDRMISFYKHVQARPNHLLSRTYPQLNDKNLLEFVEFLSEENYRDVQNLQCHMISGANSEASFEKASRNLRNHFSLFGTVENMDLYLYRMAILLGVDKIDMPFKNKSRPKALDLEYAEQRALKALINKISAQDVALYNWVREQEQEAYRHII